MSGPLSLYRGDNMEKALNLFDRFVPQPTVRNENKDRSLRGKKRRNARKASRHARGVLVPDQSTHAADLPVALTEPTTRHSFAELEAMKLPELKKAAKALGLSGWSKLKKDDLVKFIYESPENVES
jgi:hypothetical protein